MSEQKTKRPEPAPSSARERRPKSQERTWWEETPGESNEYELVMWTDGASTEAIYISRGEYIALKRQLADLRGLQFADPEYDREEVHA